MKKKINFYHLFLRGFCPHIHTENLCSYYPDDLKKEKNDYSIQWEPENCGIGRRH